MSCRYAREKVEHPVAGAMRYMTHCTLYKRYCLNTKDCKTNKKERDLKCQQSKQLSQQSMEQITH